MRALQLIEHGNPGQFEVRNIPDPIPGEEEVVIRVRACGLNHLDHWAEKGELPLPLDLPRVLGGEIAGEILEIGPKVEGAWTVGDRIAVQSNLFCGECEFCQQGEESICLKGEMVGIQRHGGFAERVLVPARSLVRMPEGLDFDTSAALTLAGSTATHMLTDRTSVKPNDWVLVMAGASGVGSAAIQIARHLGARVIATGSTEQKCEMALQLGAHHVVNISDPRWPAQVRKLTDRRGVNIVVEHLGGKILEQTFNCLARGGVVVTCGATTGSEINLNIWPLFVKQQSLVGSYGRKRKDIEQTLKWAAEGVLRPALAGRYPLESATEAFQLMRDRQLLGKALMIP